VMAPPSLAEQERGESRCTGCAEEAVD
jgi:hypothetical protein